MCIYENKQTWDYDRTNKKYLGLNNVETIHTDDTYTWYVCTVK